MERYTFAVVEYLREHPGVRDVRFSRGQGVTEARLREWELLNSSSLPDDLRGFLSTTNGFQVTWCVDVGNGDVEIGNMSINRIDLITAVPLDASPPDDPWAGSGKHGVPEMANEVDGVASIVKTKHAPIFPTAAFDVGGIAGTTTRVALVFLRDGTHQVWFQDPSGKWHIVACSFSEYFQKLHAALGLPNWQLRSTPTGMDPESHRWWSWMAPENLVLDVAKGKLRRVDRLK